MKFGPVQSENALGAMLAHSLSLPDGPMRKGNIIDEAALRRLQAAEVAEVIVASLEPGDIDEDTAAGRIGDAILAKGFHLSPVFTGRVNLIAKADGLVELASDRLNVFNALDEALTIATLPNLARVCAGQLVATVKVIPYGVPAKVVEEGTARLAGGAFCLHEFKGGKARLIMTRTAGFREVLLQKGEDAVRQRLETLGYVLADVLTVDHDQTAIANAITDKPDLTLILGASATSDRRDVAPLGVLAAGGRIERFGIPVDPGNLLFLGSLSDMPIVGLPGCARSLALNGVDWILERLSARVEISGEDIASMGVGGLLKEMPGRPQPRIGR